MTEETTNGETVSHASNVDILPPTPKDTVRLPIWVPFVIVIVSTILGF